jgi:hypothetical protein
VIAHAPRGPGTFSAFNLALDGATSLGTREAYLQGLRDLGYVEGRNVVIQYRAEIACRVKQS